MSYIQPITDWRGSPTIAASYEHLLGAFGTDEFGEIARQAVVNVTAGVKRLYLFATQSRLDSDLQYFFGEPGLSELIPIYQKCYLPFDPLHDALLATPQRSDMALQRVRPRDIAHAAFRRRFFDDAGIVERVSIVQHGASGWHVMNLARHESDGCFSDVELDALVGLACLVLPMLRVSQSRAGPRRLSVEQLEERFVKRCATLTKREREVCARAAIGMTVEATALDLGVGKTSVLTYRQRAYQRLRVTSPYELSSLVSH